MLVREPVYIACVDEDIDKSSVSRRSVSKSFTSVKRSQLDAVKECASQVRTTSTGALKQRCIKTLLNGNISVNLQCIHVQQ
jgi:hypothetical protein